MDRDKAKTIVNSILNNLSGRAGFEVIGMIKSDDKEVYAEMHEDLVCAVMGEVDEDTQEIDAIFSPKSN